MSTNAPSPVRVTFTGQYSTFKVVGEAHPHVTNYHSKSSLDEISILANQKLNNLAKGEIPNASWGNGRENIVLSVLSTITQNDVLSVLDVGGGLGAFYTNLKVSCPQVKVDYTILELAETAERGNSLFSDFTDVNFI
jgi:putative methyltransferase (TIGR04325 family)